MKIFTGDGVPTITPECIGDHYHDTTNDIWYIADGIIDSNEWKQLVEVGSPLLDDAIVDGVDGRAPSQNAVFDALALKQDAAYTPADGANWTDPDPTTIQEAIDRIADAVAGLLAGSIP